MSTASISKKNPRIMWFHQKRQMEDREMVKEFIGALCQMDLRDQLSRFKEQITAASASVRSCSLEPPILNDDKGPTLVNKSRHVQLDRVVSNYASS